MDSRIKSLLAISVTAALAACGGGGGVPTQAPGAPSTPSTPSTPGATAFGCTDDFTMSALQVIGGEPQITIGGRLCNDMALGAGIVYIVDRNIVIGAGDAMLSAAEVPLVQSTRVDLTLPAGADIRFTANTSLFVTRGGRLMAEGNRNQPISFTSVDSGIDGIGEWGGIIIQGFAPHVSTNRVACNAGGAVCNVNGEGGDEVGFFGGNNVADNSGVLRYVRLAEGGVPTASPGDEINGLTLQGVGFGTNLEFIQVHGNLDDGFEWFGGTVNAKYLVATNVQDDAIDFDEGWVGNIQHALIVAQQDLAMPIGSGNNSTGIEANSGGIESVPQTNAALSNFTIISGQATNASNGAAVDLRGDVTISMFNSVIDNIDFCLEADQGLTNATTLNFTNVLCDSIMGYLDAGSSAPPTDVNSGDVDGTGTRPGGTVVNGGSGITFDAGFAVNEAVASVAAAAPVVVGSSGFTFDATEYAGAVNPAMVPGFDPANPLARSIDGTADGVWWAGWTFEGTVDVNSLGASPNPGLGNINN